MMHESELVIDSEGGLLSHLVGDNCNAGGQTPSSSLAANNNTSFWDKSICTNSCLRSGPRTVLGTHLGYISGVLMAFCVIHWHDLGFTSREPGFHVELGVYFADDVFLFFSELKGGISTCVFKSEAIHLKHLCQIWGKRTDLQPFFHSDLSQM